MKICTAFLCRFTIGIELNCYLRMEIEAKLLQQFCTTVYWNSQVWTGV